MSTRANYEFYANGDLQARFYIHHDGYVQGAASYFHKALLKNGGHALHSYFIDAFYKANEYCEISPNLHSDIEYLYQYDVELEILTVIKFNWVEVDEYYTKTEEIIFKGTVHRFVNLNLMVFSENLKEYEDVLHSFDSDKVKEEKILKDNLWLYGTCLKLLKSELAEKVQTFNDNLFNLTADNINITSKTEEIDKIIKKILAIKKEIETV